LVDGERQLSGSFINWRSQPEADLSKRAGQVLARSSQRASRTSLR